MGGSNNPSNIIKVNIPLHAFLHKLLWEEHKCWQDEIAWKMLSGQISVAAAIKIAQSNGGKLNKGKLCGEDNPFYGKTHSIETKKKISNKKRGTIPHNFKIFGEQNKQSKKYEITTPSGDIFIIKGLVNFCNTHGLYYQAMGQVALGKLRQHKGYFCRKIGD